MNTPPSIDWESFFKRLTAIVAGWMKDRSPYSDEIMLDAVCPKDLAQIAAMEVFSKYHLTGPARTEKELFNIACRAMWHDFLEIVRRKRFKISQRLENIGPGSSDEAALARNDRIQEDLEQDAENRRSIDWWRSLANGERDMLDFIDAVVELGQYKRSTIADLLGIDVQKVTNLQRNLRNRYTARKKHASKERKQTESYDR